MDIVAPDSVHILQSIFRNFFHAEKVCIESIQHHFIYSGGGASFADEKTAKGYQ